MPSPRIPAIYSPDVSRVFLSVVVPVLNEAAGIASFIEQMRAELSRLVPAWEIVVVDDGSVDGTSQVVASYAHDDPRVTLISAPHRGKGGALRLGFSRAVGEWRFMADADLAMPPDNLARFLEATTLVPAPDIIIGSREAPGAQRIGERWQRHVIGRAFNWFVRLAALPGIHDTQCGFKLLSAAAVSRLLPQLSEDGFAFDVEMLLRARRAHLVIREVGIIWRGRADSRVSLGQGMAAFYAVLSIRWRLMRERVAIRATPRGDREAGS